VPSFELIVPARVSPDSLVASVIVKVIVSPILARPLEGLRLVTEPDGVLASMANVLASTVVKGSFLFSAMSSKTTLALIAPGATSESPSAMI
jgi:hypothetical protein